MSDQATDPAFNHEDEPRSKYKRLEPIQAKVETNQEGVERLPASVDELLALDEQAATLERTFSDWQTVLWREWCRSKDEDYAYYLFELVKDTAFGRNFVILLGVLGTILGGLAGYLVGLMFNASGISIGALDLSGLPPLILGWTSALAGGTIGVEFSRRFRSWYFWWQGQPSATRVEKALQQALAQHPEAKHIWAEPLSRLQQQKAQPSQPDQLIAALEDSSWTDRFVARKSLVALGGEVTAALQDVAADSSGASWEAALWLLTGIEQETGNRFAWRADHTQCPHCLTYFGPCSVDAGLAIAFTYYGCRLCGQSRDYNYLPHGVVAVLDGSWSEAQAQQDGLQQVNWLVRRSLFDFDWVEITEATDEDVERFAVQIGNDTDAFRRSRYPAMTCFIDPDCDLSENTLRILRRTFGSVRDGIIEHGGVKP